MRASIHDDVTLECIKGDITKQDDVDAVVNAANAELAPGGGVAGAIHRAAGPELFEACKPLAPIQPGDAVITEAFDLPNQYVVHALGPVYGHDEAPEENLASAYRESLRRADEHGLRSLAFPAISTGAFGYPMQCAAQIALSTIITSACKLRSVRHIRFVLFDDATRQVHDETLKALATRFPTMTIVAE